MTLWLKLSDCFNTVENHIRILIVPSTKRPFTKFDSDAWWRGNKVRKLCYLLSKTVRQVISVFSSKEQGRDILISQCVLYGVLLYIVTCTVTDVYDLVTGVAERILREHACSDNRGHTSEICKRICYSLQVRSKEFLVCAQCLTEVLQNRELSINRLRLRMLACSISSASRVVHSNKLDFVEYRFSDRERKVE